MKKEPLHFVKATACHTDKCCVGVAFKDGDIFVANTTAPQTFARFNKDEWRAFVDGVKKGEFDI